MAAACVIDVQLPALFNAGPKAMQNDTQSNADQVLFSSVPRILHRIPTHACGKMGKPCPAS